jgi:hypothetical protein
MHNSLRTQSLKFGRIYNFGLRSAPECAAVRTNGYSSSTQTLEEEL